MKQLDITQGLFDELALGGGMPLEGLAPRMGHATDLGYVEFKTGVVFAKIVAHQLALQV